METPIIYTKLCSCPSQFSVQQAGHLICTLQTSGLPPAVTRLSSIEILVQLTLGDRDSALSFTLKQYLTPFYSSKGVNDQPTNVAVIRLSSIEVLFQLAFGDTGFLSSTLSSIWHRVVALKELMVYPLTWLYSVFWYVARF